MIKILIILFLSFIFIYTVKNLLDIYKIRKRIYKEFRKRQDKSPNNKNSEIKEVSNKQDKIPNSKNSEIEESKTDVDTDDGLNSPSINNQILDLSIEYNLRENKISETDKTKIIKIYNDYKWLEEQRKIAHTKLLSNNPNNVIEAGQILFGINDKTLMKDLNQALKKWKGKKIVSENLENIIHALKFE